MGDSVHIPNGVTGDSITESFFEPNGVTGDSLSIYIHICRRGVALLSLRDAQPAACFFGFGEDKPFLFMER